VAESFFQAAKHVKHPGQGQFSASVGEEYALWEFSFGSADQTNSVVLNGLELNASKYPNELVRFKFDSSDFAMDYGDHFLQMHGEEQSLAWFALAFTKWDPVLQNMLIRGNGEAEDGQAFQFKLWFVWQGLWCVEKDKTTAHERVKTFLQMSEDQLEWVGEEVAGGRWACQAKIRGGTYHAAEAAEEQPKAEPLFEGRTLLQWLEAVKTGKARTGESMVAVRKIAAKSKAVLPQVIEYVRLRKGFYPAVAALGKMGKAAQEAVPLLIPIMLNDRDSLNRSNAAEALTSIGGGDELVDAYLKALEDSYFVVARRALEGLGSLAPTSRRAIPRIIEALNNEQLLGWAAEALGRFCLEAKDAVPKLVSILADPNWGPDYRRSTLEALASIGTPEAVKAIESVTNDSQRGVKNAALKALEKIRKNA
jgi:hypothetical protein